MSAVGGQFAGALEGDVLRVLGIEEGAPGVALEARIAHRLEAGKEGQVGSALQHGARLQAQGGAAAQEQGSAAVRPGGQDHRAAGIERLLEGAGVIRLPIAARSWMAPLRHAEGGGAKLRMPPSRRNSRYIRVRKNSMGSMKKAHQTV